MAAAVTQAGLARVSAPPSRPPFACSHTFRLWRALGAEQAVSHRVLAVLLGWLLKRPLPTRISGGSPQPKKKAYLHSLAVSLPPPPHVPAQLPAQVCSATHGCEAPTACARPRGGGAPYSAWPGQGGL